MADAEDDDDGKTVVEEDNETEEGEGEGEGEGEKTEAAAGEGEEEEEEEDEEDEEEENEVLGEDVLDLDDLKDQRDDILAKREEQKKQVPPPPQTPATRFEKLQDDYTLLLTQYATKERDKEAVKEKMEHATGAKRERLTARLADIETKIEALFVRMEKKETDIEAARVKLREYDPAAADEAEGFGAVQHMDPEETRLIMQELRVDFEKLQSNPRTPLEEWVSFRIHAAPLVGIVGIVFPEEKPVWDGYMATVAARIAAITEQAEKDANGGALWGGGTAAAVAATVPVPFESFARGVPPAVSAAAEEKQKRRAAAAADPAVAAAQPKRRVSLMAAAPEAAAAASPAPAPVPEKTVDDDAAAAAADALEAEAERKEVNDYIDTVDGVFAKVTDPRKSHTLADVEQLENTITKLGVLIGYYRPNDAAMWKQRLMQLRVLRESMQASSSSSSSSSSSASPAPTEAVPVLAPVEHKPKPPRKPRKKRTLLPAPTPVSSSSEDDTDDDTAAVVEANADLDKTEATYDELMKKPDATWDEWNALQKDMFFSLPLVTKVRGGDIGRTWEERLNTIASKKFVLKPAAAAADVVPVVVNVPSAAAAPVPTSVPAPAPTAKKQVQVTLRQPTPASLRRCHALFGCLAKMQVFGNEDKDTVIVPAILFLSAPTRAVTSNLDTFARQTLGMETGAAATAFASSMRKWMISEGLLDASRGTFDIIAGPMTAGAARYHPIEASAAAQQAHRATAATAADVIDALSFSSS